MNTVSKSRTEVFSLNAEKTGSISTFWKDVESARFALMPLILVITTCIGSVAAAVAIHSSPIQLGMVALAGVIAECLVLALAPMRVIVLACVTSVVVDILIFILALV